MSTREAKTFGGDFLPDESDFNVYLKDSLTNACAKKTKVVVAVIDIDNLRAVNNLSGRRAGDEKIRTVQEFLVRYQSENVRSFRFSGDEFVLVCKDGSSLDTIIDRGRMIVSKLASSGVPVSAGVAIYPDDDTDMQNLVRDADIALNYIKVRGKGNFAFFEPMMYESFRANAELQDRIINGLRQKQFMLFYQPQFYLQGHKLRGFEALIRWKDERGWHEPKSFIPLAEKTNVIQILGSWVLEKAVETLADWQYEHNFSGILSVNVSPVQLRSALFVSDLSKLLCKYDIRPNTLELEITEGVFISDIGEAKDTFEKIHALGVRISLDDFGTGYSSLGYLGQIPVNTLKLDKSFIDNLSSSDSLNEKLLASIVPVVNRAGMETIAEGIEHSVQLDELCTMSCSCVQGFLWGKPIPEHLCDRYLEGDDSALDFIKEK